MRLLSETIYVKAFWNRKMRYKCEALWAPSSSYPSPQTQHNQPTHVSGVQSPWVGKVRRERDEKEKLGFLLLFSHALSPFGGLFKH